MDDHSVDSSQDSPVNPQFDAGGDNAAASTSSSSTTTTTTHDEQPPPPPPQDDDQEQREKALSFVKLVRDTINDTSKFRNFLQVMLDFKHKRISEAELCKRVKEMLKDYPILLPGLSTFLPTTPTGPTPTQDDLTPELKMTREEVHRFMGKVKIRFQNKNQNYQAFLQLVLDFGRSKISRVEVMEGVFNLFDGNEDLMEEFTNNYFQSDDSNNR